MTHGWKCKTRQLTSWKPLTANFFLLHLLLKKGQIQACIRTSGFFERKRLLYPFGFWSFDQRVLFCRTFQATVHCAFSAYPITPDSLGGKYNVVQIGRAASPKIKTAPSHPTLVWGVRGGHKLNEYPEVKFQCTQKKQLLKSPLWKEKEATKRKRVVETKLKQRQQQRFSSV